jgi:hopanoid-associated phosphorylase
VTSIPPILLAATGLRREARIVSGPGILAISGGGDAARLEAELERLAPQVRGILSTGLAGALAPGLEPGDWVVAGAVLDGYSRIPTHPEWTEWLLHYLPGAMPGLVAGSDEMVTGARWKAQLRKASGAVAVDMESHIAGRVAQRHGLPFAVARVISDSAKRNLPPAAMLGMRPDGRIAPFAVLGSVLRDPLQIPALLRTGIEAERAFRALLRGNRRLGAGLGAPAVLGALRAADLH